MTLGDRVALLRRGELQQVGTPRELYEHPINMFVAGFIGSPPMNFVPGLVSDGRLKLPFHEFDLPPERREAVGDRELVMVGIRPERFEDLSLLDSQKADTGEHFEAKVDVVEWLGNEQYAYIPYEASTEALASLQELERDLDSERLRSQLVVALDPTSRIDDRSMASIWFDPRGMALFDPATGENLTRDVATT
jgi:multiple sugar transport system ATP-binding protein